MKSHWLGIVALGVTAILLPTRSEAISIPGRLPLFVNLFSLFQVTPTTIALTSNDPDGTGGTSTGSSSWGSLLGLLQSTWRMSVSANASQLTNCSQVPLSAFKIVCGSIAVTGIDNPTWSCGNSVTLSTTPQVLASGTDGKVVSAVASHTVTFTVNFTDSWKYPATTTACSIPLTYNLTVQ